MDVRYWRRAIGADLRHAARTPGFAADLLRAGLIADGALKAPVREILDVFPEAEELAVTMGEFTYRRNNLDPMERFALALIAQHQRPSRIVEIGTFDGSTTLLLARNAPGAEVLTLDLDQTVADAATVEAERENARSGVGRLFHGTPESERIVQLLGDSRSFDLSPWRASVDLILIDGGHAYETVAADTRNALELVAPGGTVVWDDYAIGWPGVVRAVEEAGVNHFRVANTDLAVASF
jgi:predicted O-methyltransferase YrrM